MFRRLTALIKKEILQLVRNTLMLRVMLLAPMIQLLVFGYAAVMEVSNIHMGILDRDNSSRSRELRDAFATSDYFILKDAVASEREISELFDRDKIQIALVIPPDLGKNIEKGRAAPVQILVDGTNSVVAGAASNYASGIIAAVNMRILGSGISPAGSVSIQNRFLYNPALNNKYFFIPGVMAMIIMVLGMPMTAMSIVREKEYGTYEQLVVTPITSLELIIGKVTPFVILIFFTTSILIPIILFWFKLPLRGDLFMLFVSIGLFLMTTLGIGIFVSTISGTQHQAMLTSFFILMPMILFSGFMFPIENMPPFFRALAHMNPMTYFLLLMRHIFLKGTPWHDLMPYLGALSLSGLIIFTGSISLVRKRSG